MGSSGNDEHDDELRRFLVRYPQATLADVMAEFDLTDAEAETALRALRGAAAMGSGDVRRVRYRGDIHADVQDSAETIAARINELHLAIWAVEECGAHPLLTDAVNRLGERMRELRRIAPQYIHYDN